MAATTTTRSTPRSKLKNAKKTKLKSSENATKKPPATSAFLMLSTELLSFGRFNDQLPSFVTRGLDEEQIWQQCDLRNAHKMALTACTRDAVKVEAGKPKLKRKKKETPDEGVKEELEQEAESDGSDSESGEDTENMLDSIKKRLEKSLSDEDDFADFGDDSEEDDNGVDFDFELEKEMMDKDTLEEEGGEAQNKSSAKSQKGAKKRTTVVDDKFFKLADMEQFLESEDAKEEKKRKREEKDKQSKSKDDSDDSSDEEDTEDYIDMFEAEDSDEDPSSQAKYTDFFDPPDEDAKAAKGKRKTPPKADKGHDEDSEDDGDENEEDVALGTDTGEEEASSGEDSNPEDVSEDEAEDMDVEDEGNEETEMSSSKKKKVSFEKDLLESDDSEEKEVDTLDDSHDEVKSTFELRQEKLQQKAREMEDLSLKEASWELTGETSASKRPENSLLETVLDFQHTSTAAPVITDETTKSLEDYIKQRVKDKTFDDVERKEKPKDDVIEYKKRIVLDQEKSKLSLGELYEQEFLKQQQHDEDEVKADPECESIEKDLNKLFKQLDALSNFRYTPMKPGTEVKIIVNTPAISMEEVAPVATTDADLLAPEEVHGKKRGELKAVDERDSTDKKRARRQKKKEKRLRHKAKEAREKVVEKLKPGLGNKHSKAKALRELEQLAKSDKSVTMVKGDRQKLGSSASFFNQLQDEVQTNAKAKRAVKESKKKVSDASKLML